MVEKGENWGDTPLHVAARLDVVDGDWQVCKRTGDDYHVELDEFEAMDFARNAVSLPSK